MEKRSAILSGVFYKMTCCCHVYYGIIQKNNRGKWLCLINVWKYEYKYRRGGKTLCALYARENCIGFMVVFGQEERAKFEASRDGYSKETQKVYDEAQTYRDGKWIMFEPKDTSLFDDFIKILSIKRKPNKK